MFWLKLFCYTGQYTTCSHTSCSFKVISLQYGAMSRRERTNYWRICMARKCLNSTWMSLRAQMHLSKPLNASNAPVKNMLAAAKHLTQCLIDITQCILFLTNGYCRIFGCNLLGIFQSVDAAKAICCPTPFGMKQQSSPKSLSLMAAGTSCTDVSAMGAGNGLFGSSSRPLAIWMSQVKHCRPVLCLD